MEPQRVTREWLESLDPAEFVKISAMISDIERGRAEQRRLKLEGRRRKPDRGGRSLRLERVRCGKEGCGKCAGERPELHGPYWYLYRPKKGGKGRTSEYVGKTLPEGLAEEFGVPEDERGAG